ncbi:unnamed protein product [Mytilus coruscus]|uniref:Integrase catalytic domain-containing protein n=1 Tax=Mytilus coruscus TaxID=42192 RepID=A0A6J8D4K4_MYTCO|nr:unnamed protein product [Mytilus coruscus]
MSRFGYIDQLITDSGPQFACREFAQFAKEYGFVHTTTSPHYPQANGQAERFVQTVKNLIKKSKDPYKAMLDYRNTPLDEIELSSAQLHIGRRLKSSLPTSAPLLKPTFVNEQKVKKLYNKRQQTQEYYFNKHSGKPLRELKDNETVMIQHNNQLTPGKVVRKHETPRSYIVETLGEIGIEQHLDVNTPQQEIRNDPITENFKQATEGNKPVQNQETQIDRKSVEPTCSTRSGRSVKVQIKYNDYKDHPIPVKEKVMVQTSKKKNCPESIIMKEVICFPDFKVTENTEKRKRVVSEKIRDLINGDDEIKMEYRIYMKFPTDQDHQNTHQLGKLTGFMNPINKDVSAKIDELVGHGVSSVSEMRRHLKVFVNETLFSGKTLPSINDVAYYPTETIIRKHMYMAQTKLKYSKIDQENMLQLVAEWQQQNPVDIFDLMPAAEIHSGENGVCLENIEEIEQDDSDEVYTSEKSEASSAFFFCHQTQFQRHLLQRYGNSLCMLDATYRTTKYALPLFFVAVKTNVGYSVRTELDQMDKKISNGVSGAKDKVLAMLRRCAHATTLSEFDDAVLRLNQSFEWKSSKRLQDWINKTWMPEKKRWSWAFRNGKGLLVNTNNGLERQNKTFKYKYLEEEKKNKLQYVRNGHSACSGIPAWDDDEDRPSTFIRNCMDKMNLASAVDATDVEKLCTTSFKVIILASIQALDALYHY